MIKMKERVQRIDGLINYFLFLLVLTLEFPFSFYINRTFFILLRYISIVFLIKDFNLEYWFLFFPLREMLCFDHHDIFGGRRGLLTFDFFCFYKGSYLWRSLQQHFLNWYLTFDLLNVLRIKILKYKASIIILCFLLV